MPTLLCFFLYSYLEVYLYTPLFFLVNEKFEIIGEEIIANKLKSKLKII